MKTLFALLLLVQQPIRPLTPSERPYMEGTVWVIEYARAKEGMADRYLERLAFDWRAILDQARGEGLIVSYKVFQGMASTPRDWDIMTMIELRNMAALDGLNLRLGEVAANLGGGRRTGPGVDFADLRDVLGTKITREILLRPTR